MPDLATSPTQRLNDAIAALVTANSAVQTIAGRSTDIVGRWKRRKSKGAIPRMAMRVGPAIAAGGIGETYDVNVTLRALAVSAAVANALLRAAGEALTAAAFATASCNALVTEAVPDDAVDDDEATADDANAVIAELDLVINLTM